MLRKNANPIKRFEEYHEIKITIDLMRQMERDADKGSALRADARQLVKELRVRRKRIAESMRADCWRCYGTGAPMEMKIDWHTEHEACPECKRENKLPLERRVAITA